MIVYFRGEMSRQKKIFLLLSLLFTLGVIAMTIDFMARTTPPGARKHINDAIAPLRDSTRTDSVGRLNYNNKDVDDGV